MKKRKIDDLIASYLSGELSPDEKNEIREILSREGVDPEKLADYQSIYKDLDILDVPEPSENMHREFRSMLSDCKRDLRSRELHSREKGFWDSIFNRGFFPKLAYGLSLLVIGWIAGYLFSPGSSGMNDQIAVLSGEVKNMKEVMMLTMLQQPSASERMKAVSITHEFSDVNTKIADALIETLNTDPNVNVRLVTVETLTSFAGNPRIREGLIQSITKQNSPLVQLALADVMLKLKEKRSAEKFRELLNKKHIDFAIKEKIEETVKRLI